MDRLTFVLPIQKRVQLDNSEMTPQIFASQYVRQVKEHSVTHKVSCARAHVQRIQAIQLQAQPHITQTSVTVYVCSHATPLTQQVFLETITHKLAKQNV